MAKKPTYPINKPGAWVYPTMPTSFTSCCDCGLVHKIVYYITPDDFAVRDAKRKWRYGRRIRLKVYRDYRKTAQNRRAKFGRKELYITKDGWYVAAFPINERKLKRKKKK